MISNSSHMDQLFKSLSDGTRRDILRRLVKQEMSVSEIAEPYELTYAAISKHLKVLEDAHLVSRRKEGRKYLLQTNAEPFKKVDSWLDFYREHWPQVFDNLDTYLTKLQQESVRNEQ